MRWQSRYGLARGIYMNGGGGGIGMGTLLYICMGI